MELARILFTASKEVNQQKDQGERRRLSKEFLRVKIFIILNDVCYSLNEIQVLCRRKRIKAKGVELPIQKRNERYKPDLSFEVNR